MVFKIGDNDYSKNVVMDSYNVNQYDVYKEWEDANGTIHRHVYRKKVKGTFTMQFDSLQKYQAFLQDVSSNKDVNGFLTVLVMVNNTDTAALIKAFIDYTTIQGRHGNYTKIYNSFDVQIEEI